MRVKIRDPKFDKRHLYGFHIPEFYYAEGEPCDTPKWVDYEALSLRYGPGKYDFRIIPRENIVSIDGDAQPKPVVRARKEVRIKGSAGKSYLVVLDGSHSSCECAGFQFRRSCKHVGIARSAA